MVGKVAVVTGGTRGIGRASAIAFAEMGYAVVTCGRDQEGLAETESMLSVCGTSHLVVPADLTRQADIEGVIDQTVARFGRIDVLVNNAGVAPLGAIDEITDDEFQQTFQINCAAIFYAVRKAWPVMKTQQKGTIISISSLSSIDPFPGFQIYGASKAWLNLFTKSIADEGRPHGIHAFSVALGAVETRMLRSAFPDFAGQGILMPVEVARMVSSLVDPAWHHATGSTIPFRK
jgi:NAD(P)-dependent dehydrogenase (short-subunit alcohol dehydrogenase family)